MGPLIITSLKDTPVEHLHKAFLLAFDDYEISVSLTLDAFSLMLRTRDIDLERSVGCFVDNRIVGFMLCGYRNDAKEKGQWYDGATAVIPEFRSQKIASKLIESVLQQVDEKNEEFLLEVLEHNEKARALYERFGFIVQRTFDCYEIPVQVVSSTPAVSHALVHDPGILYSVDIRQFDLYRPSWQNDIRSIYNARETYRFVGLLDSQELVAYGFVGVEKGDIPQIGILPSWRNDQTVRMICTQLKSLTNAKKMILLNVERASSLAPWLIGCGFTCFISQYEMVRTSRF